MAYNDCIGSSPANTTQYTIYQGRTNQTSGTLVDFVNPQIQGLPTVTFSASPTLCRTGSAQADPLPGTDAYAIFHGKIDFGSDGHISYASQSWWIDIEFTDLNPADRYTFVGTAIRVTNYEDRWTRCTISGHSGAENTSSTGEGMAIQENHNSTDFRAGNNHARGQVVRWTNIDPGPDGRFTIRTEPAPYTESGYRAYPLQGFMLANTKGNVGPQNRAPIAEAGPDQTFIWPNRTIALAGSVTDDDPCDLGDIGSNYGRIEWTQIDGPKGVLFSNVSDPQSLVLFPAVGSYELQLQAWDELENESRDTVVFTMRDPEDTPQTGSLQVRIDPPAARTAGAQWRIRGGTWRNSGQTEASLTRGFYEIEFKTIHGWDTPASQIVAVNQGQSATALGTYVQQTGSLQVTILPADLLTVGAQWRVNGGPWYSSGETMPELGLGEHILEFSLVSGWLKPGNQTVSIEHQQTTSAQGIYREMGDVGLMIGEIMAIRKSGFATRVENEDVEPDWLEIMNPLDTPVLLGGWFITDDPDELTKWPCPDLSIPAGGHLIFFASDKKMKYYAPTNYPYQDERGRYHTNFTLDRDGEYLALVQPDGITIAHAYNDYPVQRPGISYGYCSATGQYGYFRLPSPGAANSADCITDRVADTRFSVKRGFYNTPFRVNISSATPGARIRYTTDGSRPTTDSGQIYNTTTGIEINTTTTLRAIAYKTGSLETDVDTQIYIFLDDVRTQTGAGFPDNWGHKGADYAMDPHVVGDNDDYGGAYRESFNQAMLSIPSVSLVMAQADWFSSSTGIYTNTSKADDQDWERWVSMEFIDPCDVNSCQIDALVTPQGGSSTRGWKSDKVSLRLKFKEPYGATRLRKPILDTSRDACADSFDTILLDARLNNAWNYGRNHTQRRRAQYTRDQYVADLQNALGGYGPHNRHVHLYLNGLYWGLYNLHELPDETFAGSYYGGDREDYHAIKHSNGGSWDVVYHGWASDAVAHFNNMVNAASFAGSHRTDLHAWDTLNQTLDVADLVDYLMVNYYVGNTDWGNGKNWYATAYAGPDRPNQWHFHSWDAEHCLYSSVPTNRSPLDLHNKLKNHDEYRMIWADRIYKHMYNKGALTTDKAVALYQHRLDVVDQAVIGESARWGDNRYEQGSIRYTRGHPTRDPQGHWITHRDELLRDYFPRRRNTVLNAFRNEGLYPQVEPPDFQINGKTQLGGHVPLHAELNLSNTGSYCFFSLDGSDPRLPGGAANQETTSQYTRPLVLEHSVQVKARKFANGQWSALQEAVFAVGPVAENLRITEIMYHPLDPNAEYIELQNIGTETINLNRVHFSDGIQYTFGVLDLASMDYVVLAKDPARFQRHYGPVPLLTGPFDGNLSNAGERLELQDAVGQSIHTFTFRDNWYRSTDGQGFSLVVKDPFGTPAEQWSDKVIWRPSADIGGSPGTDDSGEVPELGDVVINEILTHSHAEDADWIELYNTSNQSIDIGGWFLSDDSSSLRKYQIAAGTTLPADGYVVFMKTSTSAIPTMVAATSPLP